MLVSTFESLPQVILHGLTREEIEVVLAMFHMEFRLANVGRPPLIKIPPYFWCQVDTVGILGHNSSSS